jgi:hypothetical protein
LRVEIGVYRYGGMPSQRYRARDTEPESSPFLKDQWVVVKAEDFSLSLSFYLGGESN